ncbi:MAG: hypothetical protein JKY56_00270 [Kofleriaceae bacterium]|nr:hypothetical protein [Kofleriaceae bacterium]
MRTLSPLPLLVVVTSISGLAACSTYSVRRSALVPHVAPITRSGQAMERGAESSLGVSTLVQAGAPTEVANANAGLFIPRTQVNAAFRARYNERTDVGFTWEQGLGKGATKLSPDQPDIDAGDVYGGGIAIFHSARTRNPDFSIGIAADIMLFSIPFIEYRTCVENCIEGTDITRGRNSIAVASLGIIPSYKLSRWTLFGGLTARNHPTIDKGSVDNGILVSDDEVSAGDFNIIANAGAELDLGDGFRAMVHIYQPMTANPVRYKPTIGIGVTLPLAD